MNVQGCGQVLRATTTRKKEKDRSVMHKYVSNTIDYNCCPIFIECFVSVCMNKLLIIVCPTFPGLLLCYNLGCNVISIERGQTSERFLFLRKCTMIISSGIAIDKGIKSDQMDFTRGEAHK